MNVNFSKDILDLFVFIDYDCNFGYFFPFFWACNVFELDLDIHLRHTALKGALYVPNILLLHWEVYFKDRREVLEFVDLLGNLAKKFYTLTPKLSAVSSLLQLSHGFYYAACAFYQGFLHLPL